MRIKIRNGIDSLIYGTGSESAIRYVEGYKLRIQIVHFLLVSLHFSRDF